MLDLSVNSVRRVFIHTYTTKLVTALLLDVVKIKYKTSKNHRVKLCTLDLVYCVNKAVLVLFRLILRYPKKIDISKKELKVSNLNS